jgi:hypothetical protein
VTPTTPARLRVASVTVVTALLVVGAAAAFTASVRFDAARAVGLDATPELIAAENLYAVLADADATASTSYLQAGEEDPALRRRYEADLQAAGTHLAQVASEVGSAPSARRAVRSISEQIPVYAGLVESARANNRQGFTVGAAYLRKASTVMREEILPAATVVYTHAAGRLDDAYTSGTSTADIVLLVVAGVVALVLLIAVQVYLLRRMHRIVNVGLAAATLLLVILLAWTLVRFSSEQSALANAQRHGSDAVQILSAARILSLRAHNDDNLVLIERGGGAAYLADFKITTQRIGDARGAGGLLGEATKIAARDGHTARITRLRRQFAAVMDAHHAVRAADDAGDYESAIPLATGNEAAAVVALDRGLREEIRRASVEIDREASDAHAGFTALFIAIPVLTLAGVAFVLFGLQRRIGEYR